MDGLQSTTHIASSQAHPGQGSPFVPNNCPKFSHCSAPICPIDRAWATRSYLKGEPICFYLLEYVKPGAQGRFQGSIAREIYEVIRLLHPEIVARYAPMRRALARARKTPSRLGKRPGTRSRRAAT